MDVEEEISTLIRMNKDLKEELTKTRYERDVLRMAIRICQNSATNERALDKLGDIRV